jgi:pre-mycofactocin synthase
MNPFRDKPIETVADAQRRAQRYLPKPIYSLTLGGPEQGLTREQNEAAFNEIGLRPRVAAAVGQHRGLSRTVMGRELAFPVIAAPAGAPGIRPEGELAVARALAGAGTAVALSSFATKPLAEVVKANPSTFFQIYWIGTRSEIEARVKRAAEAGAKGLIVTLDWSFALRRDRGMDRLPARAGLPQMLRFAPAAVSRPRWAASAIRHGLQLEMPNLVADGEAAPTFMESFVQWRRTPLPSWADIEWLRGLWDGPFLVKSVLASEDARRAASIGATAVSVGNHGGNNLDGSPAALRALPAIHAAVGNELEILFDGGIRRGSDVVKALALGASAVLAGRAWLWGLAAGGEPGVRQVFELLRSGIDETLVGLGHNSIDELGIVDLIVPEGFALSL